MKYRRAGGRPGLTAPVHARRVRVPDGAPVVTDGPYAETEEVLAGYTVVECAGLERAVEIASGLVDPRRGRPVRRRAPDRRRCGGPRPVTAVAEDLLRALATQVLDAVVRRFGHFDTAEDAVQVALLAAAQQWPRDGVPRDPRAWLIVVAARRLADLLRSEQARRASEQLWTPVVTPEPTQEADDSLVLLFLCCHPALSPASQIALTLRAPAGSPRHVLYLVFTTAPQPRSPDTRPGSVTCTDGPTGRAPRHPAVDSRPVPRVRRPDDRGVARRRPGVW